MNRRINLQPIELNRSKFATEIEAGKLTNRKGGSWAPRLSGQSEGSIRFPLQKCAKCGKFIGFESKRLFIIIFFKMKNNNKERSEGDWDRSKSTSESTWKSVAGFFEDSGRVFDVFGHSSASLGGDLWRILRLFGISWDLVGF